MSELATVIRKFPAHELIVRRLYARMPEFRSVCDDYETAKSALERWRHDDRKMQEFQHLIEEIEAEIEEFIEVALSTLRHAHPKEET